MGSRVIHYCVGSEILKRINLDANQFILGNLAPDAYNPVRGGSELSHFRIPREAMDLECVNLDKFLSKYSANMSDDFILGYYCHLITDNIWLKNAYRKYGHLGMDERQAKVKVIYNDYWVLNTILIDKYKLGLRELGGPLNVTIEEIDNDFLNKLITNLKNDFDKKVTEVILKELVMEEVIRFIENSVEECIQGIRKFRRGASI